MRARRVGETGFTIIEILVALTILSVAIMSLITASTLATRQMKMSKADTKVWMAVQSELETLTAQGYDNVTAGSATVQGYPMTWTVSGTDPKKVTLIVQRKDWRQAVVPDTFVTYLSDWRP
ncbi:MAG: prepilin-type N-terminal cleavage/methylation domain-containing protein [Gemmatimonadota bacterium]